MSIATEGGRRWIAWHHDFAWLSEQYAAELHAGEPWDLLRRAWPGVRQVVVSEYRAAQWASLAGVSRDAIAVVPNGIDFAAFFKLEPGTVMTVASHDLLARRPILLTPVRVTWRKNLQLAIRTIGCLRRSMPGATLVITGPLGAHNPANAALLDELTALRASEGLDDNVLFLAQERGEALGDAEIPDWYRLADGLLLTSEEEGFGLPVLEAGMSGLPVFASDLPPLREIAGSDATYFAPTSGPAEVATLIAERLEEDASYRLRSRLRSTSSWEAVYREHIRPLLTGSRP